ncbi:hypothetical protein [Streptococcus ovis]|uniref:hypothetical protein n=1 Tax=Streptococcus ovis TaxID=82806 RepID=UPI00036724C2|nr:hypothetical protein [Streptococcus ovis]
MIPYIIETDETVHISGAVKSTKSGDIYLGKIKGWDGRRLMFPTVAWSRNRGLDRVVQIDERGLVNILDSVKGTTYTFDKKLDLFKWVPEKRGK